MDVGNRPVAASTDHSAEWAELFQQRRKSHGFRIAMALVVAVVFSPLGDARIIAAWAGLYILLAFVEKALGDRLRRPALGASMLFLTNGIFAALAMFSIHEFGAWGGALAVILISATLYAGAVGARALPLAFVAAVAPCGLYLAALPFLALRDGGGGMAALLLALSLPLLLFSTVVTWLAGARALRAEAAARAQAEAADEAKSAFMAMVGHELRTPISAMLAGVNEAARTADPQEAAAHLRLIEEAGRMMRTLLNDLLDYSKLEAGKLEVVAEPFDLRRQLAETETFWAPEARARGLEFRLEGVEAMPSWLSGDAVRIRQILNNLISNALKFTTDGGVTLRASASQDDGRWRVSISVIDTGPGLTAQQAEGLFAPFRQAHAGVARTHGGTGLGLAISRTLARLMGGDLTLKTEAGKGCAFTFEAVFEPSEAPAEPVAGDQAPAEGLRILLADDHEVNRRAFSLILSPIADTLVCVEDGEAAVRAANDGEFDVILLDLNMPRMGGLEAARRLTARAGGPPILALTASVDPADILACEAAGMAGFVAKPVEPAELYAAIEAALAA